QGTSANLAFEAKKAGTASLNAEAVIDEDGNNKATASRSVSIAGSGTADRAVQAEDDTDQTTERQPQEETTQEDAAQEDAAQDDMQSAEAAAALTELSSNAYLKKFKVTDAKLKPKFSKDVTEYTVTLKEDVKQLVYTAKTDDKNAQIVAASGFANLKNGSNRAVLTVKAQDGTTMSYLFTILKEGAAASAEDTEGKETAEESGGLIAVEDSSLYVNTTFPEELLPEGFLKVMYVYKEQYVEAAYFEMGQLVLLYLSGQDGSDADFYIYYSGSDEFMDFIQLKGAEGHFIFPVQFPVGVVIPDGFQDATMQWNDKSVVAFMASQLGQDEETDSDGASDTAQTDADIQEPVEEQTAEEEELLPGNVLADPNDYYLLYAMNQDGGEGFYLYDSLEGTYQRFLQLAGASDTEAFDEENYVLYKTKSQRRMVVIGFLIVAIVILLFVLLNLFLQIRELKEETDDEEDGDDEDNEENPASGQDTAALKAEKRAQHIKKQEERLRQKEEKRKQREELEKQKAQQKQKAEQERQRAQQEELEKERARKEAEEKAKEENEKQTKREAAARKRQTERERQREEALRRINQRAEEDRETRTGEGVSPTRQSRRQGPIMFDLTTPKIDDNLTPKMQREQMDDDFEFEFINIDED
ncbi:MAG: hypothetical protein IJ711_12965, partial [Lachnospiraceae bacterium]|nr:hypothetical protein [Lachnospiraceae bacterium]